jgi:hypothetical protein
MSGPRLFSKDFFIQAGPFEAKCASRPPGGLAEIRIGEGWAFPLAISLAVALEGFTHPHRLWQGQGSMQKQRTWPTSPLFVRCWSL